MLDLLCVRWRLALSRLASCLCPKRANTDCRVCDDVVGRQDVVDKDASSTSFADLVNEHRGDEVSRVSARLREGLATLSVC